MAADAVTYGQAVTWTDYNYKDCLALVRNAQHADGTADLVVFDGGSPQYLNNVVEGQGELAGQSGTWRLPGTASNYGGQPLVASGGGPAQAG